MVELCNYFSLLFLKLWYISASPAGKDTQYIVIWDPSHPQESFFLKWIRLTRKIRACNTVS